MTDRIQRHAVTLLAVAAPVFAQSLFIVPYTGPGFEVASIKPSNPSELASGIPPAKGGTLRAVNVTVRDLLGYAFHTTSVARTRGGPPWLDSVHFDVLATAEGDPPESRIRPMVLKLLEDRFALEYRREKRQMSAYVLTVANKGPKFSLSEACRPDPERKNPCGGFRVYKRSYIAGQAVSVGDLIEVLESLLGEPVIDETGITGLFSMKLEWTPDALQSRDGDLNNTPASPEGESLFTAIQEQLGLKLEHRKMPVNVIVVTTVQKPTSN